MLTRRVVVLGLLVLAIGLVATSSTAAPEEAVGAAAKPLVSKLRAPNLGAVVLAKANKQALYYWNRERRGGPIRCTGACARAWPPYLLGNRVVPRKIAGYKGVFGVIRRPDGRRQLTYNRRPLYTYVNEGRGVVFCDNVDGWFAIRL